MGHHHWIWFITLFGSSLGIITGYGSSLDLDHHYWIIITGSRSSLDIITRSGSSLDLDHHWCYIMILLIIGSSTEPALFHAGCRPSLHVGLLQHLYLTCSSERPNTNINPGGNTSYHNDGGSLHFHPGWNTSYHNDGRASHLHSSRLEHILPQ